MLQIAEEFIRKREIHLYTELNKDFIEAEAEEQILKNRVEWFW